MSSPIVNTANNTMTASAQTSQSNSQATSFDSVRSGEYAGKKDTSSVRQAAKKLASMVKEHHRSVNAAYRAVYGA